MRTQNHSIYGRLDEPKRLFGLTVDELIPLAIVGSVCFLMRFYVTGLLLVGVIHYVIKRLKGGEGFETLLQKVFWVMPEAVHKIAFKRTPAFVKRHFIR
jgi:type IV conjugative transfer system protein TraL